MYESTEWGGNNKLILNEIKQIINMLAFSFTEHIVFSAPYLKRTLRIQEKIALSFFHALVFVFANFYQKKLS